MSPTAATTLSATVTFTPVIVIRRLTCGSCKAAVDKVCNCRTNVIFARQFSDRHDVLFR